ncbi:MAG: DUF554 domain-containing protein [Actinomycetes bacterium]
MFIGSGTVINVIAVLIGSGLGVTIAHRLNDSVRSVVTDGLGLITGLVAALSIASITDPALKQHLGQGRPVLIALASIVIGGILGTTFGIEGRLDSLGDRLKRRLSGDSESQFTQGFVSASLLFCVGPLTILGSITDGLGGGNEQLVLKSTLDFFASMAFAAALGWGVAASAISVGVVQGSLTVLGMLLGNFMSDLQITMLTATGGLLLMGISLRLLNIKQVPVANMLPTLVIAPLLVALLSR